MIDLLKMALGKRNPRPNDAVRIFHGPGEGTGLSKNFSIDKFGGFAWVSYEGDDINDIFKLQLSDALRLLGFKSAAIIFRHKKGVETQPAHILFGEMPPAFVVENSGMKFEINFNGQRQPGLFLDNDFARNWLKQNSSGKNVLNLFSFTGSLSVAAGVGSAQKVTSVDLSKTFSVWAKRNWELNSLPPERGEFLFGDSFDWLKRFKRSAKEFDIVVCDPPSFSRNKGSQFSTTKDLTKLHEIIFQVLSIGGTLVSSINSANVSREQFLTDIETAAKSQMRKIKVLETFGLPKEFPTKLPQDAYLKGAIIKDMT